MELQSSSLFLITTIFLVILSMLRWFVKLSRCANQKLPPGPWKMPIIGNLHNLVGSLPPHRALRELARKHGPLMHLQLGQVSTVIVSSPRMAREVMKTHDLTFAQRPKLFAIELGFSGGSDFAFAPYGEYWRQMRKVCTIELLSIRRVQSFASVREEEAWKLIASIRSSAAAAPSLINFTDKMSSFTSSIICKAAFAYKYNCKDQEAFVALIERATVLAGGFALVDFFPSYKFLSVTSRLGPELEKFWSELHQILEKIIQEHKQHQHGKTANDHAGENDQRRDEDLVDVLLRLQKSDGLPIPITTENIRAVLADIIAGGIETSSTLLVWAMAEMMKNPLVMKKAQSEVRKFYQGSKGLIYEKDIEKLSYLRWVIKETMRLHPPLSLLLPRECNEACKIDGYEIPLKTRVIVNAWAIGRDPEYWDDAESFVPERFDGSSIDYKGKHFEFIPFGAGRRICPSMAFGMANVELPLANLLYHFNWELPNGIKPNNMDMTEAFGLTVGMKNKLYLIATPFSK